MSEQTPAIEKPAYEAPWLDWRSPEARAQRRLRRDFTRNYFAASVTPSTGSLGMLTQSAERWLLPWSVKAYPGLTRGIKQLLGVSEATARKALEGKVSRRNAEKLVAELRAQAELGAEIAAALRAELAALPARKPNGLNIIGEDGLRKYQSRRGRAKRKEVPV